MSDSTRPPVRYRRVLEDDGELAQAVAADRRARAIDECIAPELRIARGRWQDSQRISLRDGIGLLVLEGLLFRRVGIDGRFGGELLGVGDLLRPWQREGGATSLPRSTAWRVLQPARVAVLDARVAHRFAAYPELTGALVARALDRSRNLAVTIAIVHQPKIEIRLRMMFWHLADRWGRVRADGVLLPIRLTHAVLAELIAARRPTVSATLAKLSDRHLVVHVDDGWLLCGGPPGELREVQEAAIESDRPLQEPAARGSDSERPSGLAAGARSRTS